MTVLDWKTFLTDVHFDLWVVLARHRGESCFFLRRRITGDLAILQFSLLRRVLFGCFLFLFPLFPPWFLFASFAFLSPFFSVVAVSLPFSVFLLWYGGKAEKEKMNRRYLPCTAAPRDMVFRAEVKSLTSPYKRNIKQLPNWRRHIKSIDVNAKFHEWWLFRLKGILC